MLLMGYGTAERMLCLVFVKICGKTYGKENIKKS